MRHSWEVLTDSMAHKAKNIYTLAFYRESANSVLGWRGLRTHDTTAGLWNLPSSHTCFSFSSAFLLLVHSGLFWSVLLPSSACPPPALSLPYLVRQVLSRDQVGRQTEHSAWLVPHRSQQEWARPMLGGKPGREGNCCLATGWPPSSEQTSCRNAGADNLTSKKREPHRHGSWSYRPRLEPTTWHVGQGIFHKDD